MKSVAIPFAALVAYAAAGVGPVSIDTTCTDESTSSAWVAPTESVAPTWTSSSSSSWATPTETCDESSSSSAWVKPTWSSSSSSSWVAPSSSWTSEECTETESSSSSSSGWTTAVWSPTASASSSAWEATVTTVVTGFTTTCPYATTVPVTCGEGPVKTYTVTESTILTIDHCPGGCHVETPAKSISPEKTVTAVVSSYETWCPTPTTITYGPWTKPSTIPVTKPTTVTISECEGGCTVTCPVSEITSSHPTPPPATSAWAPVWTNGTSPVKPTNSIIAYQGAGEKVMVGGSFFAAVLAAAALL